LSGFLTSTVTQQAVVYNVRPAQSPNATATVSRATTFTLYNGSGISITPFETTREKLALVQGAFSVPNETVPYVTPVCPSGECEWPQYGSLAMCSGVANLTAAGNATLLSILRKEASIRLQALFNSTLSMVVALDYPIPGVPASFPIIMGPTPGPTGTFNTSVAELLIMDNYLAYTDSVLTNTSEASMDQLKFLEIGFYWCTKTISTVVHNGIPHTEEVASAARALRSSPQSLNFGWNPIIYPCYASGTCNATFGGLEVELEPPLGAPPETYTVDVWSSLMASALFFASMYDSLLIDSLRGMVASSGGGLAQAFAASLFGDFMASESPSPDAQLSSVTSVAINTAQSLTNLPETAQVLGVVYTPQTFITVSWSYVSLLVAQLSLALLFFVITVAQTRISRMHVLKGSALATMVAVDHDTRAALGTVNELGALDRRARKMMVRLERRDAADGGGLWLREVKGVQ
ncbi:hypothetical protein GQ53DRAFT_662408, partial [Thozetella sp. PMI_491]